MQKTMASLILIVLAISGCAFSSVNRPNVNQHYTQFQQANKLEVGMQDAIEVTKTALLSMGYEILVVDPNSGLVRTKARYVAIPEICDCGTWNGNIITGNADSAVVVHVAAQSLAVSDVSIEPPVQHSIHGT